MPASGSSWSAGSRIARSPSMGAKRTPELYVLCPKQTLVYHGAIDDNAKDADDVEKTYLKDAMDALIAGREIEVETTKALGCGIKKRPKNERVEQPSRDGAND